MSAKRIPPKLQPWFEARRRFNLSDAHIQMARELGLNPKKFGSLASVSQAPWKLPLPEFIAECYRKRFGRSQPAHVRSLEEIVAGKPNGSTRTDPHGCGGRSSPANP